MMHRKICIPEEVEETVQDLVSLMTAAISSSKTRTCLEAEDSSLKTDQCSSVAIHNSSQINWDKFCSKSKSMIELDGCSNKMLLSTERETKSMMSLIRS